MNAAPPLSPAAESLFQAASTLPAGDQLALAERLTGFLRDGPAAPGPEERAELDRRVEAFHDGSDAGRPWEQVRGRMKDLIRELSSEEELTSTERDSPGTQS